MDALTGSESRDIAAGVAESPVVVVAEGVPAGPEPMAGSLAPAVEALLLSVDRPVPAGRIAEALGLVEDAADADKAAPLPPAAADPESEPAPDGKPRKRRRERAPTPARAVESAIAALNAQYEATGRSFRVNAVAGGYRVMTLAKFAPVLEAYHGKRERHGISRAALETLAIIAYKQPVTRAGLEAIRGVQCGEVLRSLMERRLVTIVGRAEELGRPMLYGTTKAFLETFGLSSVKDLPSPEELRRGPGVEEE